MKGKLVDVEKGGEFHLGLVTVSAEVVEEVWEEGRGDELLTLPNYTPDEMAADLEHDRLLHCAFGDHIPAVRTLPLAGSKCEVLIWSDTPRP